jgi:hypothetical protein
VEEEDDDDEVDGTIPSAIRERFFKISNRTVEPRRRNKTAMGKSSNLPFLFL